MSVKATSSQGDISRTRHAIPLDGRDFLAIDFRGRYSDSEWSRIERAARDLYRVCLDANDAHVSLIQMGPESNLMELPR